MFSCTANKINFHVVYGFLLFITVYMTVLKAKSLYRSRAGRHFYGTENEIWAGFGPVDNTEKQIWGRLWATFEGSFFMFLGAKKQFNLFFNNIVASALKSCINWSWKKKKKKS